MKSKINKRVLLVLIAAIAMFAVTGIVSAGSTNFGPIIGHYSVTGSGHNFVSTTGFDANYKPNPCPPDVPAENCISFQDAQIFQGELIFYKNGTGTFTQFNRGIDIPPLDYNIKIGTYDFNYTKTSERTFTYQLKPGTYLNVDFIAGGSTGQKISFEVDGLCQGVISQDAQNVIVTCGPPSFILTAVDPSTGDKLPVQGLMSQSINGIRVNE
jgi:hypothetical protein